jgi:Zn ribbon nucleic-acid-binding protein
MSTNIVSIYLRDRVCPACKIFKTINQFNKKTIRCKECNKKYYKHNREKCLLSNKSYREQNKQTRRQYCRNYVKKQYKNNPCFKLENVLRSRIRGALKKNCSIKATKTIKLLGCTIQHARNYIESQWLEGMNWDNHGNKGWHIDHIKPVNTFNFTDPEQQKQCFHYTNLRPLWAYDNLSRPDDGSDIL